MSAPVGAMLGRYRLVRKLAIGGMAEVFLAKALGPGGFEKSLVIKRILPSLSEDPAFVQMFLHEARLAAQLNHPNVAQIFDFGEVDGTYFLAMEFVDGPNLRTIFRNSVGTRLSAAVGAKLISLACEGLAYAHEFADPETGVPMELIHRDVSSDNLLIARTGAVKVVDFGVAKVAGQASTTQTGSVRGKLAYMPPEQLLGTPDLRADVYALGVILYEFVAGTRPYDQVPDVQLITKIINSEPVPLRQRWPDAPIELVVVIEKAMARNVDQRFQNCRELQGALEDFVASTGERVGTRQIAELVTLYEGTAPAFAPIPTPSAPRPITSSSRVVARPVEPEGADDQIPWAATVASSPERSADLKEALSGASSPAQRPVAAPSIWGSSPAVAAPSKWTAPAPAADASIWATPGSTAAPPPSRPAPVPAPAPPPSAPAKEGTASHVLAEAERLRLYAAGPPLAPKPALEKLVLEYERDEAASLGSRFAGHSARLGTLHPSAPPIIIERLAGLVTGMLLAEDYGRLFRTLQRLQAGAAADPMAQTMWETAHRALNEPGQIRLWTERLREAPPTDVEGLERCLQFVSGDHMPVLLRALDQVEAVARAALLNGMAAMAAATPTPFLSRLQPKKPHQRLADLCFMLEKGRAAGRQLEFKQLAARKDPRVRHQALAGIARAGSEEALKTLGQALNDPDAETRLSAIDALAKHLPSRVLGLLERHLLDGSLDSKSPDERLAIWRAVGSSDQPEAVHAVAEVLKIKASLLNKSKVQGNKLVALEALAVMKSPMAAELLRAIADDRAQPDPVITAARRFQAAAAEQAAQTAQRGEPSRWDRMQITGRAVALDLALLAQAASVFDPASAELAGSLQRLAARLSPLLLREQGFRLQILEGVLVVNGAPVTDEPPERAIEAFTTHLKARGIAGFVLELVEIPALQELVRWLAEGDAAGEVRAPRLVLERTAGRMNTGRPVPAPPGISADPSREAMGRYAELVICHRALVSDAPNAVAMNVRPALESLVELYLSRTVRFLGLTPTKVGKEAIAYHHANVTVLCLAFAVELGLTRNRLRELAELAFFHDVGMFGVPDETLVRVGELKPADRELFVKARLASVWFPFERLGASRRAASWATASLECGLDFGARDAAGVVQPRNEIGVAGGILALAKTFDALTSRRAFRPAFEPDAALKAMSEQSAHRFRPDLLPLFLRFLHGQPVRVLHRPAT